MNTKELINAFCEHVPDHVEAPVSHVTEYKALVKVAYSAFVNDDGLEPDYFASAFEECRPEWSDEDVKKRSEDFCSQAQKMKDFFGTLHDMDLLKINAQF